MKKFITLIVLSTLTFSFGQGEESKFNFSGSVDAYWRTNLTAPDKKAQEGNLPFAPASSFVNNPGFSLGMINLIASYDKKDIGFVADIAFGPRADEAINPYAFGLADENNPARVNEFINQLYMYWTPLENFKITFGRFNTFFGLESVSPVENFNYSMSHAFTFGPRNHTGMVFDFNLNYNWSLKLALFNPLEYTDFNDTGHYSVGFQVVNKYFKAGYINSRGADYFDLIGAWDLNEKLHLKFNTLFADYRSSNITKPTLTYGSILSGGNISPDRFTSISLYPQYNPSEKFSVGCRFEHLTFGQFALSESLTVFSSTLTFNIKLGDLTLIHEFRTDNSNDVIFQDFNYNPANVIDGLSGSLASYVFGAVYSF